MYKIYKKYEMYKTYKRDMKKYEIDRRYPSQYDFFNKAKTWQ